ncbi:hypothetical protein QTP88_012778 [Uroleucon formosanum]
MAFNVRNRCYMEIDFEQNRLWRRFRVAHVNSINTFYLMLYRKKLGHHTFSAGLNLYHINNTKRNCQNNNKNNNNVNGEKKDVQNICSFIRLCLQRSYHFIRRAYFILYYPVPPESRYLSMNDIFGKIALRKKRIKMKLIVQYLKKKKVKKKLYFILYYTTVHRSDDFCRFYVIPPWSPINFLV